MDTPTNPSVSRQIVLPNLGNVTRLGLATRGNTSLGIDAVVEAINRGVNYLNWCGHPDGMQQAIRKLGSRRKEVKIAVQLSARTAVEAKEEIAIMLDELATDYLDVITYYYVEHDDEWEEITSPGGAAEALEEYHKQGVVRAIGLTSHQRSLAARWAQSKRLNLLMIRYNAAHRGAETDVFPMTQQRGLPVVAFTCLRWGALLQSTPDDPSDFTPPPAPQWYRWVLSNSAVSVALMAPNGEKELEQNLQILDDWRTLPRAEYEALAKHGDRVRRHAGSFP